MQKNKMVTRAQLLGKRRRKVNIFKKMVTPSFKISAGKKNETPVCTKNERQERTFVMILRYKIGLKNVQIPFHFGVPPVLLLGQLEKSTVMTYF